MLPATSEPRAKTDRRETRGGKKKKKKKKKQGEKREREREKDGRENGTDRFTRSRRFFAFGITAACIIRRVYPPRNRCTGNYEPRNPRKARFNVEFRPFSNAPFQDTGLQRCGGTVFHCAPTGLCHFCLVFFSSSFFFFFFSWIVCSLVDILRSPMIIICCSIRIFCIFHFFSLT